MTRHPHNAVLTALTTPPPTPPPSQVLDPERAGDLSFDPLDPTKTWPEDQFPLIPVGKMVLDTNVDNFHNETEQVAFCPANVVPGIDFSDDK